MKANIHKLFRAIAVASTLCPLFLSSAIAAESFTTLEDAAVTMAKRWQSGQKARPLMSSDGKILFPYGQSMPRLTCSPSRACDVEMEPGEKVKTVALADKVNWTWNGAESGDQSKNTIHHVIFQPQDSGIETNVIIFTDRRTYHIKLHAPKVEGAYLNRVGFYYPDTLVSSWEAKVGKAAAAVEKEESQTITPVAVTPDKIALDYRVEGNADFKPLNVFNDGERTHIILPASVRTGEYPILNLIDETGKGMVVSYRSKQTDSGEVVYTVDKLFSKAELLRGSEKITILWKRKETGFWSQFRSNN